METKLNLQTQAFIHQTEAGKRYACGMDIFLMKTPVKNDVESELCSLLNHKRNVPQCRHDVIKQKTRNSEATRQVD